MTIDEKLTLTKQLLDDTSLADEKINAYLQIAEREILNIAYPFDNTVTVVPTRYDTLQCEIAVYLINKIGAEGEVQHTENNTSRTYESSGVPKSLLRRITPRAGVIS